MPVKLGALDDSSDLTPAMHMYVASAAPRHLMHEGLPTFPQDAAGSVVGCLTSAERRFVFAASHPGWTPAIRHRYGT